MTNHKLITKAILKQLRKNNELLRNRGIGYILNSKPTIKFFMPDGLGVWLLSALDDKKGFYGLCDLGFENIKIGYFALNALQSVRGQFNLPIERDINFVPEATLSRYENLFYAEALHKRAALEAL